MSDVKRYEAVHLRSDENSIYYCEGCEVEVVRASDYTTLEVECERLRTQLASHAERDGEEVEVVGWLGGNGLHTEESMASGAPFPLMTVAQHNRILAASVPAGCKVVPVELLEDLRDLAADAVEHHRAACAGYKKERQARMDKTVAEASALLASTGQEVES